MIGVLAAVAVLGAAALDFRRSPWVLDNMRRLGVPASALLPLGLLKAAGAIGLLVGLAVTPVALAAAAGLVLFFTAAIVTTVRARWYAHLPYPAGYLALAVGALLAALAD